MTNKLKMYVKKFKDKSKNFSRLGSKICIMCRGKKHPQAKICVKCHHLRTWHKLARMKGYEKRKAKGI